MKKMKKTIFLCATIVASTVFVSCNKTNIKPTSSTNQVSTESVASNTSLQRKKNSSDGKEPFLNGLPQSPACIAGDGACVEVVVTPSAISQLRDAIANNAITQYITDDQIKALSNGDATIIDYLIEVRNGNKTIVEAPMPNAQGTKAAFVIGHTGNMPTSHFEAAIVLTN